MNETNSKQISANPHNKPPSMVEYYIEEKIDFRIILGHLYRHAWFIIASGIIGLAFMFLKTLSVVPQFVTSTLIQVNHPGTNNPFSKFGITNHSVTSNAPSLLTLMQTRYILEPIVKQNTLNLSVSNKYFPILGGWMARHYHGTQPAKPLLQCLRSYAWGGEELQINKFIIPPQFEGQTFKLVVGKANSFRLYTNQNQLILEGQVGNLASSRTSKGFMLELSKMKAREHTEFFISLNSSLGVASALAGNLSIEAVPGIDDMLSSNIYRLKLTGSDPNQIVKILNAIVNYAVFKDEQQKSEEVAKTLIFLYQQLPDLKQKLENAENALNQYRVSTGTFSSVSTGQMLMNDLTHLEESFEKLKTREIELMEIYTAKHPLVISIKNQENELQNKLSEVKNKIKEFPIMYQQESTLKNDMEIKNSMYLSMLKTIHELEVSKAGIVGDIKALNDAEPAYQISSKQTYSLLMGLLLGLFLSSGAVLLRSILIKKAEDPNKIEDELQIPVQSIVPYSRVQKQIVKEHNNNIKIFGSSKLIDPVILAKRAPNDIAIESIRSLHISLQILTSLKKDKVIVVMGTSSGSGKSFISTNLAQLMATKGKRTLLIDADIRKGKLHHLLNQNKMPGLSEYLEKLQPYENIVSLINENLFLISSGVYSKHPVELLQSAELEKLIQRARNEFDEIIIDTPPVLPVSDSILIARYADTRLFVINASKDYLIDVKSAIKRVQTHGFPINGLVLNHSQPQAPYAGKYNYYYSYGEPRKNKEISKEPSI